MFKVTLLIITFWLYQLSTCKRLSTTLDNRVTSRSKNIFAKSINWVKITTPPTPVVSSSFGARIEVECEASGSPPPTVHWIKSSIPLIETESFETNALVDSLASGMAKVKAKLVIPSILYIHDDEYTCLAKSGSQIATATTRIYIQNTGNITHLFGEEILNTRQPARIVLHDVMLMSDMGSSVVLPCKTVGNPPASVTWLDSSEQVMDSVNDPRITLHSNGDLMIQDIRWDDMGPYTCLARNSLGEDTITTFLYPLLPGK